MEMTGEQLIHASQADTWAALNDPEMLKACVPGCESIDRVSDTEYVVQMTARVGPVSAKFKGRLMLSDIKPPTSYSLAFDGQGGPAGFAKGGATVRLAAQGEGTLLSYDVKANVGGKLAQIGSRLIDGAAKKVADEFFGNFTRRFTGEGDADQTVISPAAKEAPAAHAVPAAVAPAAPALGDVSVTFFAAGALVVFFVALFVLLG